MACTYGASVKPGVDPNTQILVDRSLWETVTGVPSSWIDPLLDVFTFETIKASDLCALNLSDPVTPDLATLLSLVWKDPFSVAAVAGWIRDKLRYIAFSNACVCNPATAACNTAQLNPAAMTDFGCFSPLESIGWRFTNHGANTTGGWVETSATGAGGSFTLYLWHYPSAVLVAGPVTIGAAAANTRYAFNWPSVTPLIAGDDYVISFDKSGVSCYPAIAGAAVPSVATYYTGVDQRSKVGPGVMPDTPGLGVQPGVEPTICGPGGSTAAPAAIIPLQPTTIQVPPAWTCATACDIMTRLQQVSDRLEWLRRDVTLIQRQHVPFGYVAGTPVTLLAGQGTIAVQGILGALVTLTTVPLRWGQTDDTPRRLIPKTGALSFGDASGVLDERQVHYDNQLMLGVPGAVTAIEWSFRPGVVATITPLYREP